ncbi:SDR family NAD(P)-dependent oxidoreductase [Streptomyces nanshensis]|uniref:Short-chain dehydrogenase n=1 Tax=Streptomyces nanshensis TaxID=518642 RepID=A0A1E7LAF2_9ACTN|nr:SDR family oxidoreductase [Streptomyces nanshensis]OEV13222.1 hypothetical protein AN218_04550 [Streptomyces nanshensis]
MCHSLTGQVILVTGASSGIGAATARRAAAEGARVVLAARHRDALDDVTADIRDSGGAAAALTTDVTVDEDAALLVEYALGLYGRLDGAVNNAGGPLSPAVPVADLTPAQWDADVRINLSSVMYGMRHQIPAMIEGGGGTIINVSSYLGIVGAPGRAPYSAAKHGVIGLTQTAALEYARRGVRITAVAPGGVDTPQLHAAIGDSEAARAEADALHPIGRIAHPDDIANLIVWLLTSHAAYLTAGTITADGGLTAA